MPHGLYGWDLAKIPNPRRLRPAQMAARRGGAPGTVALSRIVDLVALVRSRRSGTQQLGPELADVRHGCPPRSGGLYWIGKPHSGRGHFGHNILCFQRTT